MPAEAVKPAYELDVNDKVTSVMLYTGINMCWGDLITREQIRVSTWLRTNYAPDHIALHNAKVLFASSGQLKPISYPELYIAVVQINAFHLMPPASEPLDYDPNEPNRKFEPMSALVGHFRFDGFMRMATVSNLQKYLDVTREVFTPIYNVEISNTANAAMGVIRVPYVIVRQERAIFASRNTPPPANA